MELKNKLAIITGVSRGIGKEIVLMLLEKGAKVCGWGKRNPDFAHDNFYFIKTNIRDVKQVEDAFEKTKMKFSEQIHILINNAGLGYFRIMEEIKVDEWKEMFETNVNGIFYCSKMVIPSMKKKRYGHIINISSVAGLMGLPEGTGYCGTKFAVKGISEAMFKELREFGIKVSCVYPGSTKTDFFSHYPSMKVNDSMMHPKDIAQMIIQILEMPDNFVTLNVEARPLMYKG